MSSRSRYIKSSAKVPWLKALVVTANFPSVSETFINRELAGLAVQKWDLQVVNCFAVRNPDFELQANFSIKTVDAPIGWLAWWQVVTRPMSFAKVVAAMVALLGHTPFSRIWTAWRTWQRVLAHIPKSARPVVYAHYASTPAIVAYLLWIWDRTPYTVSTHATDIFGASDAYLGRVCRHASHLVTCTKMGADRLLALRCDVKVVRHGVDVGRPPRTVRLAATPLGLVTVARLVPKKAHDLLLDVAARLVQKGIRFRWRFIGAGPLFAKLTDETSRRALSEHVFLEGSLSHRQCIQSICDADLFVYGSKVLPSGDQDGVPNVLAEAIALGTPIVTVHFPGAQELKQLLGKTRMLTLMSPNPEDLVRGIGRQMADPPSSKERAQAALRIRKSMNPAGALKDVEQLLAAMIHSIPGAGGDSEFDFSTDQR